MSANQPSEEAQDVASTLRDGKSYGERIADLEKIVENLRIDLAGATTTMQSMVPVWRGSSRCYKNSLRK